MPELRCGHWEPWWGLGAALLVRELEGAKMEELCGEEVFVMWKRRS